MTAALTLWSHALAALLFGTVALGAWRRTASVLPRRPLLAALGLTALWALAVAGIDAHDTATRIAEGLRNLAWLAFMLALTRQTGRSGGAIGLVYGSVFSVVTVGIVLAIIEAAFRGSPAAEAVNGARLLLRMMVAVAALILLHHLHFATAMRLRGGVRLAVLALAVMWTIDLLLYATAFVARPSLAAMLAGRGLALAAVAPLFAIAAQRDGDWMLHVSRTVAYQWLLAIGAGLYVALIAFGTGLIGHVVGHDARIAQTAFVFGTTAALFAFVSTPWVRAWAKVMVAKHLFRHRYDYRTEWLRFTDTLGVATDAATSLDVRVIKAIADLTDSPAGLLLVPDGAGLVPAATWNWSSVQADAGAALERRLETTRRIVELDQVRAGRADPAEAASIPTAIVADADAWAIVPLLHFGKLAGAIVLARPPVDRALDWEDFDLLGAAGRQAASYLAEGRAHDALADAQRFDEFNRRFAFIMHDLKNLVSQLTLVARNAERHADNPAFRADMVATLQDSSARMNTLLARLAQQRPSNTGDALQAVPLLVLARRLAGTRRAQHPVQAEGDPAVVARADPALLETLLGHLIQNAIEASAPEAPVRLAIWREGERAMLDVVDRGCGMAPGFVRDQLFRPFASTKSGGFGIGAFEARQLVAAMGGTLAVASREGEGTRFTVTLPLAPAIEKAA